MSGVIDSNGQQWEHCSGCGEWVKIQALGYLKPINRLDCGADLCIDCANILIQCAIITEKGISPANSWIAQYG